MASLEEIATAAQLERYAHILTYIGLGNGEGIRPGEIVLVACNQGCAFFLPFLQRAVTEAGGHMLLDIDLDLPLRHDPEEVLIQLGSDDQIAFYPLELKEALYRSAHHRLTLKCQIHIETSPSAQLRTAKIRRKARASGSTLLAEMRAKHWNSYTLAYLPTAAMAKAAGISLNEYWDFVVKACFLDDEDCVETMRLAQKKSEEIAEKLTELSISAIHIKGQNADLHLKLEPSAKFVSSNGGNVPSFEVFTAPRASETSGSIKSSVPILFEGTIINGAWFLFENGVCVEATADEGENALHRLLDIDEGMRRLGEFALTGKQSPITQVLPGSTLWLENMRNTLHIALGRTIAKCYRGEPNDKNEASAHYDFVIEGGDLVVTATLPDGSSQIIFTEGDFTFI